MVHPRVEIPTTGRLKTWLVIQNLPTISPPADVGLSAEAPGSASTAVHPADRKFFDAGHMALLKTEGRSDAWANVNPADRKFFTNGYGASGMSGEIDPLANVHPADRKFFTNGYGSDTP